MNEKERMKERDEGTRKKKKECFVWKFKKSETKIVF